MSNRPFSGDGVIITAAIAAVIYFWWRNAAGSAASSADVADQTLPIDYGTGGNDWGNGTVIDNVDVASPVPNPSLPAFLYMIRSAENGDARFSDQQRYGVYYGGSMFSDYSDHPVKTGEKSAYPLPDKFCKAAGLRVGCKTTAAGAYQIILPTWQRVRQAGSWGAYLGDFGPASQDEAARRLMIERGALDLLLSGDVQGAISRVAPVWASLPGSVAGQGGISLDTALALYSQGQVAYG